MPIDLLTIVGDPDSERNLRAYFAEEGESTYTGRRFERLDGGGDRPEVAHTITAADLVAVEMLSVQVPAAVAIRLLEGPLGPEITELLAQIPTDVELGTEGAAAEVADGSPADRAWHLLDDQSGVGWVAAGKLLARKRPLLIPVWDRVLACQFGEPKHVWLTFDAALGGDDGRLRTALADLRRRAEVPDGVSLIRVFDVVMWMRHHEQHLKAKCPGFGTVTF